MHGLDPRFKLLSLALIGFAALGAHAIVLLLLSAGVVLMIVLIKQPLRAVALEVRYFFVILGFIFIARALVTPGAPLLEINAVTISREGLQDGLLVCWRLVVIVMTGFLLVATTRSAEMKAAVQWFLKPVPFIPEKRVATMMSLVMRFVPVILDQAKETAIAQRARGVENRKNPLYRFRIFMIPLIRRTFETADRLAVAMEARCYVEERTDPGLSARKRDWIALFAVLGVCVTAVVL
jgi:energy-coupling factor transporter transmembrane protein EcfT